MRFIHLSITLLLSFSTLVLAETAPINLTPFEASLKATRYGTFDISVNGTLAFQIDANGHWQYSLTTDKGLITSSEVSRGSIQDNHFLTHSFRKNAKVLMIRENSQWDFDWNTKRVTGEVDKDKLSHALNDIIYDPLSYQLAMRAGLQQGETEFEYRYLRYKNPVTARFIVIGEELLEVGNTRVMTKIIRQTAPASADTKRLIWVAPELDFVPVRFATYVKDRLRDEVQVTAVSLK